MLQRQKLLELVQANGPVLPKDISQTTRENMLFVSAMLSELVSAKKIKYSHLKVGSSPLYYFEGQEEKLQNYSEKLPGHLKEAYAALYKEKVIKDSQANARVRAGLRELKDFAQGFTRTTEAGKELFWKWYLLSNEEATAIVRDKYAQTSAKKTASDDHDESTERKNSSPFSAPSLEQTKNAPEKSDSDANQPPTKNDASSDSHAFEQSGTPTIAAVATSSESVAPNQTQDINIKEEMPQHPEEKSSAAARQEEHAPSEASTELQEMRKMLEEERKKLEKEREQFLAEKRKLAEKKELPEKPKEPDYKQDTLYQQVAAYLATKELTLLDTQILKKNSDISGRLRVASPVGDIAFFVRAKSKKRLTKKDFEELHSFALEKKHPVLLALQTELPKKTYTTMKEDYPLLHPLVMNNGRKNN